MKVRISFFIGLLFFICVDIAAIWGLYHLLIKGTDFEFKYLAIGVLAVIIFALTLVSYFEITEGKAYYVYIYIPIDDIEKQNYKNALTLNIDGYLYSYSYRKDELDKLTEIKGIQYYNLKKKAVSFIPIPYTQI